MSDKPSPCPYCGVMPEVGVTRNLHTLLYEGFVECVNRECHGKLIRENTIAEAIETWDKEANESGTSRK